MTDTPAARVDAAWLALEAAVKAPLYNQAGMLMLLHRTASDLLAARRAAADAGYVAVMVSLDVTSQLAHVRECKHADAEHCMAVLGHLLARDLAPLLKADQ